MSGRVLTMNRRADPGYGEDPVKAMLRICRRIDHSSSAPASRWHLGNQSCTALKGDVLPQPGECDDEAVACLDEKIDVHHAPEQPAEETCELEPPELDHRGLTPNGGEVTHVPISEWRR